MGKKKLTPNQQLFNQELNRIKRFINKKQKEGYHFNFDLPTMPSRVTQKALRDIKAITPLQLYSNAEVVDQETGEIIKAIEYQAQKRSEASKKGWETRKSNPDYKKPAPPVKPPKEIEPEEIEEEPEEEPEEDPEEIEEEPLEEYDEEEPQDLIESIFNDNDKAHNDPNFIPPKGEHLSRATSKWDQIRGKIESLEPIRATRTSFGGKSRWVEIDYTDKNQKLIDSYERTTHLYESAGKLDQLEDYCDENWRIIESSFDAVTYDSNQEVVNTAYAEILNFLDIVRESDWTDYADLESESYYDNY